jgi:hypothetical protein
MAIKFNALTGKFDLVETNDPNFSYTKIASGESVEIPAGQEMLTQNDVMVEGDLFVYGDAIQLPDQQPNFFWTKIVASESIVIPTNRLMLFANNLMVEGDLLVNGELTDAFFGVYF